MKIGDTFTLHSRWPKFSFFGKITYEEWDTEQTIEAFLGSSVLVIVSEYGDINLITKKQYRKLEHNGFRDYNLAED